jgi:hypothetical protein
MEIIVVKSFAQKPCAEQEDVSADRSGPEEKVDIRARGSQLFVLEINILPGLSPWGLLSLAARGLLGIDHAELICLIARGSINRQGVDRAA